MKPSELTQGRYLILEEVGRGGMGEVYKALDQQLDRVVAIKAIRPDLAADPNIGRRLKREARLAASLDHPFICKIHELLHLSDGQALLVMEYVEGETLKSVLRGGRLELHRAVRIAAEIAEALSVAHRAGLIHRDVKPANIILTPHDHVKIMDFGVAKTIVGPDASTTTTLTGPGRIVGTPAYMSPEQAAGLAVDARSDIFSFGVVFFESLTGELPFDGADASAYLHSVNTKDPKALPNSVPTDVRDLVGRCLEKEPAARIGSFEDVKAGLDAAERRLLASPWSFLVERLIAQGPRTWLSLLLLVVATSLAVYAVLDRLSPPGSADSSQVRVQGPVVTWPTVEEDSRLSPDGATISFVSAQGGGPRLWLRSVAGSEPRPIVDFEDALKHPIWSPDSERLAYLFRDGGDAWIRIVSKWGEALSEPRALERAWDDVGLVRWIGTRIYFSVSDGSTRSVLWRYEVAEGTETRVTHPVDGLEFVVSGKRVNIDVRSDESRVAFTAPGPEATDLWIADLDGRNAVNVTANAARVITPRWKGPDETSLVYVSNENGQYDIWQYQIATGQRTSLTTSPMEEETVDVARAGDLFVADTVRQTSHLWAIDPDGGTGARQLTNDSRNDVWPSTTPTSDRLIFHRSRGSFEVFNLVDTEVLVAEWRAGILAVDGIVAPGFGGGISADGSRAYFLRHATGPVTPYPELWVKDLGTPRAPARLWDRFWFSGQEILTSSRVSRNAAWGPTGAGDLYFARRAAESPTFEIAHASIDDGPSFSVRVLVRGDDPDERFGDLAPADREALLAYVASSRRPYRGGALVLLDLEDLSSAKLYRAGQGTQLLLMGWSRRGNLAVAVAEPGSEGTTELIEVDRTGGNRTVARIDGVVGLSARLDAAGDRVFVTAIEGDVSRIDTVSLTSGERQTLVSSAVPGVTFGGYVVTRDGWLLYSRKETNNDVWVFDLNAQPAPREPEGTD